MRGTERVPQEQFTVGAGERPTWQLRRAVLVYESENRSEAAERMYATLHKVEGGAKGPRLSSGVPATREACADLARALGANATLGGFIPANLLFLGSRSLMWWRPPSPARVFFDTTKSAAGDQPGDKSGAALIGKKNAIVPHPGLVFAVAGSHWYVYAVKGARPVPADTLYRAPYFNVYADGEICTGNVRLPETLSAQSLAVYEKAFFDSEFTHPNARGKEKLIRYSSGPYGFWADYLKAYAKPEFPTQFLVDTKVTLQRLAKALEKGGRNTVDDE